MRYIYYRCRRVGAFILYRTHFLTCSRYVPSEGAVAFILKTRSAAIRDNDNILAVIKSTDVSHNGRSQGLVAPNVKAQAILHQSLLRKAGLFPDQIKSVNSHPSFSEITDLSITALSKLMEQVRSPSEAGKLKLTSHFLFRYISRRSFGNPGH